MADDPLTLLLAALRQLLPGVEDLTLHQVADTLLRHQQADVGANRVSLSLGQHNSIHGSTISVGDVAGGNMMKIVINAPYVPLQELLYHHESSTIFRNRLDDFVGRESEIADIRVRIAQVMPTGGYVTITAQAGEGKSSVIAKMVEQDGPERTAFHFIALTPGRDYQLSILRTLMARLIVTHTLPATYFPGESYSAMRDYFPHLLLQLNERTISAVIYVDGLDQLDPDLNGVRDLSFLPTNPPPGIVFVLGTRPDDTLKPLEVMKPQYEYRLPHLEYRDFVTLLGTQAVDRATAERLYTALSGNAFYLALAVREMKTGPIADLDAFVREISDNPDNLFGLTLERLRQRGWTPWKTVLVPTLALLLVAQEPLSRAVLREVLELEDSEVRESLSRLGGFIAQDGDNRSFLYHLKIRDYLQEDLAQPEKAFVISQKQIVAWHARLATWCGRDAADLTRMWQNAPGVEGMRRQYGRHHYVTHLALGEAWDQLRTVLDDGIYGRHKRRFDLSTHLYAQDLDRARDAAVAHRDLACLWRWSLLHTSLASRMDQWPDELFLALVAFGRAAEALASIELITDAARRVHLLSAIAPHLSPTDAALAWQRAHALVTTIPHNHDRPRVLATIAQALVTAGNIPAARAAADAIPDTLARSQTLVTLSHALVAANDWAAARAAADAIPLVGVRSRALASLAAVLRQSDHPDATATFTAAHAAADAIPGTVDRSTALATLATALITAGDLGAARATIDAIPLADDRSRTLACLATAMVHSGAIPAARATIDAIPLADDRSCALANLAATLAHVGHSQATATFITARTIANAISDMFARSRALAAIVHALIMANDLGSARTTADTIPDDRDRSRALTEIAARLYQVGHPDATATFAAARATTDTIAGTFDRARALENLVVALVIAGDAEAARATANAIPDDTIRSKALATIATVLIRSNDFRTARAVVDAIPDDHDRSRALITLAIALVTAGDAEAARAAVDAIPDDHDRSRALTTLAGVLHQVGHPQATTALHAVRSAADTIPDADARSRALTTLAVTLHQVGHPEAARTLQAARVAANTIPDVDTRSRALTTLAVALATVGHVGAARAAVNAIPDADARSRALATLAVALATVGHVGAARAAVNAIPDADAQSHALADLTTTLAQTSDFEAARVTADAIVNDVARSHALATLTHILLLAQHHAASATLAAARATADAIVDDHDRSRALADLAAALATGGSRHAARAVAAAIPDAGARSRTLANLSTLITSSDYLAARAAPIPDDGSRVRALAHLAQTLATAGNIPAARAAADAIPDADARSHALMGLAAVLHQAGYPEATAAFTAARAAADAIPDADARSHALIGLAAVLHQAGYPEATAAFTAARAAADTIVDDHTRSRALTTLVVTLATAGNIPAARAAADAIPNDHTRPRVLITLVVALATAGNIPAARAIADAIPDVDVRSHALTALAQALAAAGNIPAARAAADAILDDARAHAQALVDVTIVLNQASRPQTTEMRQPTHSLTNTTFDDDARTEALVDLAAALHTMGDQTTLVTLVGQTWRAATTRDDLMTLMPIAFPLLGDDPTLGTALHASFAWVDDQFREES